MTGSIVRSEVRPRTLAGLLRARAAEHPDRAAYLFVSAGPAGGGPASEDAVERLTWGELDRRARAIAASLAAAAPPGERALLLYPPGLDFVVAFFACLYTGAVAVPAYPPRLNDRSQARLRSIVRDARPRAALTTGALAAQAPALVERVPELAAVRFLATDPASCNRAPGELPSLRPPEPAALAFLQYTSGSTSAPKGVMVTHANLLHNERMIGEAFEVDADSVVVGWLPLHHDMGLIGNVLQPLHAGAQAVLMSPVAFLQRPRRWLEAIDRYRGTIAGGPNFAYDLCVRKVPPAEREGLDLSSWRVAFNGAEPVRAGTLERFAAAFAPQGFRRRAFYPCYGLAEATLFVAGADRARAPSGAELARVVEVDAAALAGGEAVPATPGVSAVSAAGEGPAAGTVRRLVASGRAFAGQRIAIVDAATASELPAGAVGEIWVAGDSVARGYWRNEEATALCFGARLAGSSRTYLRTGDLGFVQGGELFVTGRSKDLLIVRGRNLYPQDLELSAEMSHPELRPGGGAAFAVETGAGAAEERLVLVQEVERRHGAELGALAAAIRQAVAEDHEVQPHEVILVRAGTVPKTSSGKVQRFACRESYLAGELAVLWRSGPAEPAADPADTAEMADAARAAEPAAAHPANSPAAIRRLPPAVRAARLELLLRERAAAALGLPVEAVAGDRPLTALGLDSLSAVEIQGAVEAAVGAPLAVSDLLEGATARELAAALAAALDGEAEVAAAPETNVTIQPAIEPAADRPLSIGQRALWFLERLAPAAGAYNIVVAARLRGRGLEAGRLRWAMERLVERHAALRSIFPTVGDEPVQRTQAAGSGGLDFAADDAAENAAGLAARLVAEAWRPFDLEKGPLVRVRLLRPADGAAEEAVLLLAVHHLVADFWSLGIMARDLARLLGPAAATDLTAPRPSDADFARRQGERLAGAEGERLRDFWRRELAGERGPVPDLALPTDRPRPPLQTWRGVARGVELPPALGGALRRLAAAESASLFAVLAAAWQVQLGRYAEQDDFAIGVPTSGRGAPEWGEVVGYFVNPVALRADLRPAAAADPDAAGVPSAASFRQVVARTRQASHAALDHAAYPFVLAAEMVRPVRDPARPPIFQVLLAVQPHRAGDDPGLGAFALGEAGARLAVGGIELTSVALAERRAQLELSLAAAELAGGGLGLSLTANADLFDATTAERMLGHLAALLAAAAAEPQTAVDALPLLTAPERQQIEREWNDSAASWMDDGARLHDLVAAQAARIPDAVAVAGELAGSGAGVRLSYGALAARAGEIAAALAALGIDRERRVGLCLPRTPDLVAAILGVLEAGGVYVPLDPTYPQARLELMLADSGAEVLLTDSSLAGRFPFFAAPVLLIDRMDRVGRLERPASAIAPGDGVAAAARAGDRDLAYVIYTSGSTGRPKGTGIEHRSAVSLVRWALGAFPPEDLAGVLAATSVCFDLSIFEIFVPLAAGGRAILVPNVLALADLAAANEVTLVNTVPSPMAELVGRPLPAGLRTVNLAGERLEAELAARIYAHPQIGRVVNLYGPTEDTTYSTGAAVPRGAALVSIGRPLANRSARVLGPRGEALAAGLPGELFLAGDGLARGYLGQPQRTAERFVPDPFGPPGARMYRTGDRARLLADGRLDYLGRFDDQVKIRGFRIEPGEVAAVIAEHPAVRQAAVLALAGADGARRLVAFVAPELPADLRAFLAGRLPEPLVPAAWLALPSLPQSGSGKVDRAALARHAGEASALGAAGLADDGYAPPREPREELLTDLFARLLGRERVGIHDDFFALGGHSLLATRAAAQVSRLFGVDLPLTAIFSTPTVAGLAARLAGGAVETAPALPPIVAVERPLGAPLPLSAAQRRLWFLEQLEPGTATYNMPGALDLAGPLDVPALAAALGAVARRHQVLRAVFTLDPAAAGEPLQRLLPTAGSASLPAIDLAALPAPDRAAERERLTREEARRPFDLSRQPGLRVALLRLATDEHRLLATFHHIAADGWSLGLFLDELAALYPALAAADHGTAADLPPLPAQYADFASWQDEWLRGAAPARELSYWRQRLGGLPALELPFDHPRERRGSAGGSRRLPLGAADTASLDRLARQHGITRFMGLLGAFQALLARWTGADVIAVGSPVANRRRPEVERSIGLFVNTLVLDAETGDDPPLAEFLGRVRRACLGAYAHQDLPFERLVEELAPQRDLGRNPLFQVALVVEEPLPARATGGLVLTPRPSDSGTAKFDLSVALSPTAAGWVLRAEYPSALWEAATIDRLLGHFRNLLLAAAAASPAVRLADLPLLSPPERQQLVVEWNDTAAAWPAGARLEELVAAQAARIPDAVAVVGGDRRLTYGALGERAQRLGDHLRGLGVGPEVRVGLAVERGPQLLVGVLGILAAGGAFVALDPAHPRERLAHLLADCGAAVLLTESAVAARLDFAGPTVLLDAELPRNGATAAARPSASAASDADLAYVMYTSGSTGLPKGVAIAHRSAINMVRWTLTAFSPAELAGSLAATSVGFDVSIFEMLAPLAAGGRLILAPDLTAVPALADSPELALLTGVPSPLAELVDGRLPAGVTTVNLGGEALKPELVERIYAHPQIERVLNLYGPAENTTYSTCSAVPRGASLVTVGRPVANTGARLLGRRWAASEPPPLGVAGEIAVYGAGLARGYLGRPDLTAERFVPDALGAPGARLYRTGDRARVLPDGTIDYLGRLDHQVKLRGVRLELGEIEVQLERHPAVRQVVVALRTDGAAGPYLAAYVVPAAGPVDGNEDLGATLAAALRERLPAVMVPAAWVVLAALPLSPNGKVDRRALPAPERSVFAESAAPRNAVEEKLAALWSEVLGRPEIGIHDSFFDLGGHSLLALRVALRTSETFGVELPVSALFEAPTIAALAERLAAAGSLEAPGAGDAPETTLAAPESSPLAPLSGAQQRLWFLDRLQPGGIVHNLPTAMRLCGRLDAAALARALAEIVGRHEPLRTIYPEVDPALEGAPFQRVLPAAAAAGLSLSRLSLAALPAALAAAALAEALDSEARRPFDLRRGPVVRFLLVEEAADDHVLAATFHHIATDGWSLGIFLRELAALYAACAAGRPSPLPPLALRYRDAAAAERAAEGLNAEAALGFWRRELAGVPPLELPADRPRPAAPGWRAVASPIALTADLAADLGRLARSAGATPFMVYFAAFAALLSRWTDQEDFGVGVPVAGRRRAETQGMIGLFVNTLVLRAPLAGDPGFGDLLARVRAATIGAQAHQEVPFERLVEELQVERSAGVSPLFQAMFAYLNDPAPPLAMPGLEATLLDLAPRVAEFDLILSLHEWQGRLAGWLALRADLFDPPTAARFNGHLEVLLAGVAADPARRLSELPLLTAAERAELALASGSPVPWRAALLHGRFEERAAITPAALAVIAGDETVTYAELEARANRLAHHLLALRLAPEARIAVFLERSLDLEVALLAVLKAGGVYLPLDPGYPPERVRDILADAGAAVLVTLAASAARLPSAAEAAGAAVPALVLLDRDAAAIAGLSAAPPAVAIDPRALAYLIYTSGSTGRPKGVGVPHGAAAAHVDAIVAAYEYGPADRVLQLASPGFDVSVEQILCPLAGGGALVVAGAELWAPQELLHQVGELGLTYMELPTAYWHRLVADPGDARSIAPLRLLAVGGEEMLAADVRAWSASPFAGVRLINVYGPTETVITSAFHVVGPADGSGVVPIGRPLAGRSAWVVDRTGAPRPPGIPGELVHGGPLARGYLGRPELTAERFVPDPFSGEAGGRLYRTGDRVRLRRDGHLEFLGRLDGQVKIRGFRVELGEVEAVLTRLPAVREAAVAAFGGSGDLQLAAWVVAADPEAAAAADFVAEIRAALRVSLPEYMVPSAWAVLPALPLSAHGKVDRRALPAPQLAAGDGPAAALPAAATPEEEIVAGIFATLVGRERVAASDSFFDLGGHSLLATQLASRLRAAFGVELPLAAIFEAPTPAGLARRLAAARREGDGAGAFAPPPVVRAPDAGDDATAPLSFPQQRLWFLHQLEPGDAYHVPGALRLRGALREAVLERALAAIVERHESLRTVFRGEGAAALQVVLPAAALTAPLPIADLSALPETAGEGEAARLLAEEARQPFDLAAGPLLRLLLVRRAPADRLLSVVMHHIISDAWSLAGMLAELSALYAAFAAGEPSPLPALPIQYPDFARWQRRWLDGEVLEREVAHWRRVLAGAPESLELPFDRPPAPDASNAGARLPFALAADLYGALAGLARAEGWTPFMALLAGFQALLARSSGQDDVVVGSPIANRNRLELEGLLGFLTNTLALRLDLAGDPSFRELGRRVRAVALDAYAHQDLPFEKLVVELAPDRHLGRNPLFQTMLVLQRLPPPPDLPGVEVEMLDVDTGTAKFDLTLMLGEEIGLPAEAAAGGLSGVMEYASALFDAATVERLLGHLRNLLAGAVADPSRRLADLPLLSAAEHAELAAWTAVRTPSPPALLAHAPVEEQAARRPDAVAVAFGTDHLTYAGMISGARRLARRLAALGVGPDVPVGLYLERSLDMPVAVLGVLAAGGAYLPLDPTYPAERLRAMLADSGAPVLIADGSLAGTALAKAAGGLQVVRLDEAEAAAGGNLGEAAAGGFTPSAATPEHLVFVVYTSGTTGRPKGVAMTHGAISSMLLWQVRTSAAGAGRTLQFTSLSFDVSFQEMFSAWWAGGTVVLVSEEVRRDPAALAALLADEAVERLFLPFVALQQVATAAIAGGPFPASLREVMSAGEQLYVTPQVAELFGRLPGAELHNHYGPSEAHAVTWLRLTGEPAGWPERPSIGRPIDHARAFLLDAWLQPAPLGVPGDIWVGGPGVGRGYLGRPELTADRFMPDPFDWALGWRPGDRLYRTGDLARRHADGSLEFLGRRDAQVKIRGHRIELAEVETALARHPAVLQAAVAAEGDGAAVRRLVAYVVLAPLPAADERPAENQELAADENPAGDQPPAPAAAPPTFGELRAFLAESLPEYMVPAAWARLDALPVAATGKLDRRALARIPAEEAERGREPYAPPRTPLEELLAGIWRQVLGAERVGLHDDFFALGGHSLLATQVTSRVREVLGVELPLREVFQRPALGDLAAAIEERREAAAGPAETAAPALRREARPADLPLSFAQERLWVLDRLQPGSAAYNIALALRAVGRLDTARLAAALAAVVRRHEVLRTVFAERDGVPVQVILPAAGLAMPAVDLGGLAAGRRATEARRLAAEDAERPFDLARGPLFRALAVDLAPAESLVLLAMHHIAADGWSLGVLVEECQVLYAGGELPELPFQYADFALWQRRWLAGGVLAEQLAWWRQRLAGSPEAIALPADRPRPAVPSQRGADLPLDLPPALARRLGDLAAREGATPFMVLAAALFAFLRRLTGERDLTLGVPIANRNRAETEALIGFFVNTLVLRADVGPEVTFGGLLRQVREASLGAFAHQDLPYEKLVDELRPGRDLSRPPLFQVALLLQNAPLPAAELGGVRLVAEELPGSIAKFDLSFAFVPDERGFTATLQYAADLFDATTARRLGRGFGILLASLLAAPAALDLRAAEAPILAAEERHHVLCEWNDTAAVYRSQATVVDLLADRFAGQPDAIAAIWEGASLSYGELARRAARLARFLRRRGARRGVPVAIWMERSLDTAVAVVGALTAGAHYVPLDPAWPLERAAAVLAGIGAPIVLTRSAQLAAVLDVQWRTPLADVVCLDVFTPEPPAEAVDGGEVRALWDFVAERAVDRETAGGFVSSFTGEPFTAAEVDEYRDRVLALAEPWLRPGARVLEIGSGAGLLLWEMAPRVARIVGLDPSAVTQEKARAEAAARGLAAVELPVGFAHELDDLVSGSFDLIVLASTVQFFPGPVYLRRVVEKAVARLAPGGALLVADVPDARRREELRRSLAAAASAATTAAPRPSPASERWWDEELFHSFGALPGVERIAVLHRREGFANELRFRYDVLLTRGESGAESAGRAAQPVAPAKRLWTGWHVERCPADALDDRQLTGAAEAGDLAYVIHTSGSTGEPKAIGVEHRRLVNHFGWVNGTFGVGPGDRLLFVNSLGFDLSVYDLLGTLAAGGTVQVAPEAALRDPERLARMLGEEAVTVWHSAPSALLQLAPSFPAVPPPPGAGPALRLALLAGDWIPLTLPGQIHAAFPLAQVLNLGGATETSVWSNTYRVDAVDPRWTAIPYGRPIANARYHLLDENLAPCPIGVVGDMYIGGEVLSRGYLGRPAATAAAFIPDPLAAGLGGAPGSRLWATGDRGRYAADGNLEFLGRVDGQVKVSGYRIELGEIEVALSRHPGVREAVAVAREDTPGEPRLVAYVVPARPAAEAGADRTAELRAFLQASLPEYMVPWAFVELERLPVTHNGKLDRDALPAPRDVRAAAALRFVAPRNDLERAIGAVWREVLGVERIGVQESFFQAGGSSLLLARLQSRLARALGRDIPFVELFKHPTIESLARSLGGTAERSVDEAPEEAPAERVRARSEARRESLRQSGERGRRRRADGRGVLGSVGAGGSAGRPDGGEEGRGDDDE